MIARAMEIPVRSAAIVMSDLWSEIHGLMTGHKKLTPNLIALQRSQQIIQRSKSTVFRLDRMDSTTRVVYWNAV
jgi:hypothetical protein